MTLVMAPTNAMMNGLGRSVEMMQDDQLQTPDDQILPTFFCRALYDYQSQDNSSLSFYRGDIIEVLTQMKSGWWDGMLGEDRGWFPSNYVQPITDDEAEAELSRHDHAGRPTDVHDSAIDVSQQYRTVNSEQEHEWLEDEEFGASRPGADDLDQRTGSNAGAASDFWVPQVTDLGQVYYLNTHTGERAREIPSGPGELTSDSDLAEFSPHSRAASRAGRAGSSAAMNAPPSRSGSAMAGFGVSRRGGTPEPWTKRLADDGLTHFYVNKLNGQVSWTLPTSVGQSSYGSEPRQESTRLQGASSTMSGYGSQFGDAADSAAPSRMRSDSVASQQQTSAKRLSVYSDDSDIQPQDIDGPTRPTRARKLNGATQTVNRDLKDEFNLTPGERNALQLQQRLAAPDPESIDHLSDITREAIIVVMAAVDDNGLPKGTDHDKQVEQHVTSVVVAVRNLLYISCALSSALPPSVGGSVGDPSATAVAQQLQAQLKTSQRKVTATLSKLVLSARAARYKREAFSSDMMIRVEQDAADLQRAVDNFVAEVKKQYARTAIKQLHARIGRKRLRGTFAVSYVGLGLPGAGAAATWKGLGFVNVNDGLGLPKRNLDGEAVGELRGLLGNLEVKFNQLNDLLSDPGSTADEVLGLSQELLAHLSSTLTFVSDLSVAQDVDVEGGRSQPGSSSAEDAYLEIVARARQSLRKLEIVIQALYDDSASVFLVAQSIPFGWSSSINQDRLRLVHKLDSLSDLLRSDARITLDALQDIMDICVEQSASANLFRESMALRMSRMSILDGDQRLSNFFGSLPSGPDEEEDVVDMEIAFRKPGVRPVMDGFAAESAQSSPPRPEPDMNHLGHFRNDSQHSETLIGDSETTLRRSEDDDLNGDPIIEKAPPRAAKIRQLLGPDVPERIFDNNDAKPWYLRSDHNRDDLIINPDGGIRAGTLPSLVERLTSHEYGDPVFIRTFLMTYKSFTNLDELLDLLTERYRMKPPDGLNPSELEEWSKLKQHVVRSRVLNTLKTMVTDDEILEKDEIYILDRVKKFLLDPDVAVAPAAKNLLVAVERKKQGGSKSLTATPPTSFPPPSIIPKGMNKNKMKLLEIDPLELARQLTLLESTLYKRIRPFECLQRARESKQGESKDHITDVIQLTNKIANWVNSSILSKEDSRKRAALVKHFINMADRCRQLQNYSSMAAIVSGLNSTPIRRLKRTWDQVSGRFLSQLETCESTLDAARSFTNYKNTLASVNPPCIPFMGVYLTTLTFIQEGSKDKLPGNLINFGKRQRAAEVIREIQRWQSKDYNLAPLAPVLAYIEDALNSFGDNVKWEDQFYNLSLEREPREREDEKMARLLQESGFL